MVVFIGPKHTQDSAPRRSRRRLSLARFQLSLSLSADRVPGPGSGAVKSSPLVFRNRRRSRNPIAFRWTLLRAPHYGGQATTATTTVDGPHPAFRISHPCPDLHRDPRRFPSLSRSSSRSSSTMIGTTIGTTITRIPPLPSRLGAQRPRVPRGKPCGGSHTPILTHSHTPPAPPPPNPKGGRCL